VPVGNDVALGIDNDAGTKRALADSAGFGASLTALPPKNLSKKSWNWLSSSPPLPGRIGMHGAPMMRILDGRLGVDVDHGRLQLLGNLGEGIRQLLRSGNGQGSRIRRLLPSLPFTP